MKKQLIVIVAALFITVGSAFAQGQRMTVDEKVKIAMDKVEAGLKPTESARAGVKTILVDFYTAQQKKMEEMRASGNRPDREEMMKVRQEMADERDGKLKNILSAEQFTKWKNEIEPGLRPQRPAGEKKEG